MVKGIGLYPRVRPDTAGAGVVSQAGAVVLVETMRAAGLDSALSVALRPWRRPAAQHDPGKVIADLAIALALGGDCLADVGLLRAEPGVFGPVASDPTVSRTVDVLAADAPRVLAAIDAARATARARVWALAGEHAPDHGVTAGVPLVVDVDATLVTAHSDKELAAPTFKRGSGSIRSGPSPITARRGPVSRCRSCCAGVMPGRTPPPITSQWSERVWPSCPGIGAGPGPAARS